MQIILDDLQKNVDHILDNLKRDLEFYHKKSFFLRFDNHIPKGIYLWGDVGRGKSFLIKKFYENINIEKKLIHFHEFMIDIHNQLKIAREKNYHKNPIEYIVKNIKYKLICIDEFFVKDIVDAMIIGKIFHEFLLKKITIVITSNVKPDLLYKDGLQKNYFNDTIDLINRKLNVVNLNSDKDYRLGLKTSKQVYFIKKDNFYIKNLFFSIIGDIYEYNIESFGRNIRFENTKYVNDTRILYCEFNKICNQNFSSADYIKITIDFNIIMIDYIPYFLPENRDDIIRFIKFIDILYENKTILICSAIDIIDKLYTKGDYIFEYMRTISRINEMQSDDYIKDIVSIVTDHC